MVFIGHILMLFFTACLLHHMLYLFVTNNASNGGKHTPQSKNNSTRSKVNQRSKLLWSQLPLQLHEPWPTNDCCATQLIDGDGEFNIVGLDNFIRTLNLTSYGLSYTVVAIMEPQSSGAFIPPSILLILIAWFTSLELVLWLFCVCWAWID